MSAAAFKEECEMHWQMPVTVFKECIKPFFVANICFLLHFLICVEEDCGVCISGLTLCGSSFSDTTHHSHGFACLSVADEAMAICPSDPTSEPSLLWFTEHAPTAPVAFRCVADCDFCCPSLYYSSEFCKRQICDEVPSSLITSSFISPDYVVWHRDAFSTESTECLQTCYQYVSVNVA